MITITLEQQQVLLFIELHLLCLLLSPIKRSILAYFQQHVACVAPNLCVFNPTRCCTHTGTAQRTVSELRSTPLGVQLFGYADVAYGPTSPQGPSGQMNLTVHVNAYPPVPPSLVNIGMPNCTYNSTDPWDRMDFICGTVPVNSTTNVSLVVNNRGGAALMFLIVATCLVQYVASSLPLLDVLMSATTAHVSNIPLPSTQRTVPFQ